MAGGAFTAQNKVLPGVYINIKSAQGTGYVAGERGTVTLPMALSWGAPGQLLTIQAGEDVTDRLGYDLNTAPQLHFLRELFLGSDRTTGAQKVLLWRLAAQNALQASAKLEENGVTVAARYPGVRGNDIAVSVIENPDGGFIVKTLVDGVTEDTQRVTNGTELTKNNWVSFSKEGTLQACAIIPLTGGTDGTTDAAAWSAYLTAIEPYEFDILVCDSQEKTILAAVTAFIKRLREQQGKKCQAVVAQFAQADTEGILNVCNGIVESDVTLTPQQATWWVGGTSAGANYTESLTYAQHPNAVDVSPKMTVQEQQEAVQQGGFVFFEDKGKVRVLTDINSLVSLDHTKTRAFCKNRVIRTLDMLANSLTHALSDYQIGSVDNDSFGRSMIKKEVVAICAQMMAAQGIQDFDAEDVTVEQGQELDAVLVTIAVQPVDAVEKIYITATVS